MSSPSTPTKLIPGAWPELARPFVKLPPGIYSSASGRTTSRNVGQENTASPRQNTPEMPTASAAGDRPLSIMVPPSAYCPFSTDSLDLPAPITSYIGKKFMPEFSHEHASCSVPSTPGLDATPSSSNFSSNPNAMASPTHSHFATMPVTPQAHDNCDNATIPIVEPRASMTLMTDPPKLPDTNLWLSAGSSWLTDFGGNTETDHIFRNTLFGALPSLSAQSSPLTLSITSPASNFPAAFLPNMSSSFASTPISSPSAPSSLHCISSVYSPTAACLALSPTSTAAFPSSIDSFERWREDVTVQMRGRETMPQTPSADDTGSSVEHTERAGQPPGINRRAVNPRVTKSKTFLQKAKKFGGRFRRFVTRAKRSKWQAAIEADAIFGLNTHTGSDDGSIVVISAHPPPYGTRPAAPTPLHSPEQRRRSMPMLSPHYVLVRERASRSAEGHVEIPLTAPPARGPSESIVPKVPTRRFSLAAFSNLASLKRP
ncbi:uncharacterized protein EDB91DRAFT_281137 [Suillus paluster]|uniref:uncharacterized protein n=1 Tax=Suillus paluster TaxID=48578 RepID=UPI001B87D714|nr:uncharacterized protein EDB91DRAFT_281137 [Suillus paluster]KAG1755225.1 hypothetical protein EDB91DRAFT_281137 [Suillus paluster]